MLWYSIPKRQGHTKSNKQIKKSLYNSIVQHPQVVHSPIENYCLKVSFDGHNDTQLVPKMLLQVSVREIHNNTVSPPE